MNATSLSNENGLVAPAVLVEIDGHVRDGSVRAEYIGTLVRAIEITMEAIAGEDRRRDQYRGLVDLGPVTKSSDWNLIQSLMALLEEQARACAERFSKLELATCAINKAVKHG